MKGGNMIDTKTAAKQIRAALKAKGWNSKAVSVRVDRYSMGSSIHVKVKSPDVDMATVKAIAERYQRVDRCEYSGEILSGGNRFIFIDWDSDLVSAQMDELTPILEQLREGQRWTCPGIDVEVVCEKLGKLGSSDLYVMHDDGKIEYGYCVGSCARQLAHKLLSNGCQAIFPGAVEAPQASTQESFLDWAGA
jgi:hypothetical protein